jgi:hypothetical protein
MAQLNYFQRKSEGTLFNVLGLAFVAHDRSLAFLRYFQFSLLPFTF